MSLVTIGAAWLAVAAWFLAWETVSGRLDRSGNAGGWLRAPMQVYIAEAFVLVLLAALWFSALGSGGWPLVFGLLGLLMEWPGPLRHGQRAAAGSGPGLRRAGLGIVRVIGAGALCWWLLR